MFETKETPEKREIADYNAYLQLKELNYTDTDIANHLSYSEQQLADLITKFTFEDTIEH